MAGIRGKSGGKRVGSGRPSLKDKTNKKLISLSNTALESLEYYSKELGLSKSDILDALCVFYLDKNNKDITHCPKCGKPLVWESLLTNTKCDVECVCGYIAHVGDSI